MPLHPGHGEPRRVLSGCLDVEPRAEIKCLQIKLVHTNFNEFPKTFGNDTCASTDLLFCVRKGRLLFRHGRSDWLVFRHCLFE